MLPTDYLKPTRPYPLVHRTRVEDDHVIFVVRIAFEQGFCKTFDEGVARLLDEIGPRPGTFPNDAAPPKPQLVDSNEDDTAPSDRRRGTVEFAAPAVALQLDAGLPLVLAVGAYAAAFNFVNEYQLIDIHFPQLPLSVFPGPKFGSTFLGSRAGATRLGVLIKPRFVSDPTYLRKFVLDVAAAGVDYLTDDELTVGTTALPFHERVKLITNTLREANRGGGRAPAYVANITGRYQSALLLAHQAHDLGAQGVMVNSFAMGYDAITSIASDTQLPLGILSNSLGRGVITKGPDYRVAADLVCKLARLAGADGVYTGPMVGVIDNSRNSVKRFERALTQPYYRGCQRHSAAAIMSGGIGLPELLKNDAAYDGPLFLSIGYQFAEAWLAGVPAAVIVECIRSIWDAVRAHGQTGGREALKKLAKQKDPAYKRCIAMLHAEEALAEEQRPMEQR